MKTKPVAVLESGATTISRVPAGDELHTAVDPWVTTYRVQGPRVTGAVEVGPAFLDFDGWRFMPDGLYLAYGPEQYRSHGGSLVINGVRLAGALSVPADTPTRWGMITIRRALGPSSGWDSSAPGATQRRAREILRVAFDAHLADEQHAYVMAAELARARRPARLGSAREAAAGLRRELAEVEARLSTATDRLRAMEGDFEQQLVAHAPASN
ncbi:hypothetical protein ACFXAF_00480 [Kitasatospora sp. NPDC059463]|uniref:hypothetical protein n=1 Tax=unclassified Kitasatospora TaxID=2633591 RepID=UPI0036C695A6